MLFKYVPLRTRRSLLLYKVYGNSAFLILNRTLLMPFWLSADDVLQIPEGNTYNVRVSCFVNFLSIGLHLHIPYASASSSSFTHVLMHFKFSFIKEQ